MMPFAIAVLQRQRVRFDLRGDDLNDVDNDRNDFIIRCSGCNNVCTGPPGLYRSRSLPGLLLYANNDSGVGSFSDGGGGPPPAAAQCVRHVKTVLANDFKQLLTLKQHYYPEGGWGWIIVCCGLIVQTLSHGLHTAGGVFVPECIRRFGPPIAQQAGNKNKYRKQKKKNIETNVFAFWGRFERSF